MAKGKQPIAKNGNITSFFKPVPKSSSQSSQPDPIIPQSPRQSETTPRAPPPAPATPSKSLVKHLHEENRTQISPSLTETPSALRFLDSSPSTSPSPKPRPRDAVIKASDDEDSYEDESDDEFPDLLAAPRPAPAPASTASSAWKDPRLLATPRANRTSAVDIFSSPLDAGPKRIKLDINTLLKHAKADQALEENAQRVAELLKEPSPARGSSPRSEREPKSLHDSMRDILSDGEGNQNDEARAKKEKLLRAVKRAEADVGRRQWFFFKDQSEAGSDATQARQPPFPRERRKGDWGSWSILAAGDKRRMQYFEDSIPYQLQKRRGDLPDEIFQWVLNETIYEKSWRLREPYLRLLSICPHQTGRLVDEEAVKRLFRTIGASEDALAPTSAPKREHGEKRPDYLERDWSPVEMVLRILAQLARGLSPDSLTRAMSLTIRLGIDDVVREEPGICKYYQEVLKAFVEAVPDDTSWNDFCGEVANSLYSHTQEASLRWNAVSSIPILSPKLVDLRRRLALVFVFGEPQFARVRPEETFSMRSVLQQISGESAEFLIDRNNTDFYELRAMYDLLCVAVAGGVRPPPGAEPAVIRQYDAEVDEIAMRLKIMWSGIHEGGAAFESRLEAKAQLKDFERKLLHVVRTRPPRKENIFGINEDEIERQTISEERSRNFMSKFLGKQPTAAGP